MLTLNLPDLTSYLPIALLLALAVLIGIILLVRAVLHSRLTLLIAVISGVVVAGPVAGSIIMQFINALTSLLVIGGILIGAGAILIRRSPDLRALACADSRSTVAYRPRIWASCSNKGYRQA